VNPTALHKSTLRTLASFAIGVLLLVLVTALEHRQPARTLLDHAAGAFVYLALQSAIFFATLIFSAVGFWHGTTRDRLLVSVPAALVLFYFALFIAGPG
jgi:hypothetical protein